MSTSSDMADRRFTPQLCKEIDDALAADDIVVGPLSKLNMCMHVFRQNNIIEKRVLNTPKLFVHPRNRGGLGINAFNSHKTLKQIRTVGADRRMLLKSVCFEVTPMGDKMKEQLDFNKRLVEEAGGFLAPLTGMEQYLSVSSSHFSQACKAVRASCTTPFDELKDSNGKMNLQHICRGDTVLRELVEQGWEWEVLPWYVEHLWPTFPDLAQRALNSEHTSFSMASELETASTIASSVSGSDPVDWTAAIDSAKAAMPPCADYIEAVGQFVRLYGGGAPDFPIIKYRCKLIMAIAHTHAHINTHTHTTHICTESHTQQIRT